ncbi:glucose 1-dehydrogenase [Actinophytocola sp.]|uniref:SDR family NAD(P)-dependent oxidoreductase n=1 Tax=Actinophytocola sp. TaxID=1872138 RepID=UPI002ED80EAC
MNENFAGKVALVTGGGSGIGRAAALALAGGGARVLVAGRRAEPLTETVELVRAAGGEAAAAVADISRSEDLATLVGTAVREFGGLHIAVNNAGVGGTGLLDDLDEDDWARLVDINLTGTWLSMKHEIEHMRAHGGGSIVNVASNAGAHLRMPIIGAYGATKAAITALSRAAARHHIADGIRINVVSPGPVATDLSRAPGQSDEERDAGYAAMIPRGRIGDPAEIATAIAWLASESASFVVGADLVLDGGVVA